MSSKLYDESVRLGNGRLDMVSVIEAIEARTEGAKSARAARASAGGVLVVRSSRVGNGMVMRSVVNRDDELGFIASDTLSPQKARILAMLALAKTSDLAQIQKMFYEY